MYHTGLSLFNQNPDIKMKSLKIKRFLFNPNSEIDFQPTKTIQKVSPKKN
jgi:hypothetical protein